MERKIAIIWGDRSPQGTIEARNGNVSGLGISKGSGTTAGTGFSFQSGTECRLEVAVENAVLSAGAGSTILHVRSQADPFSFFLRDVASCCPIYIPEYKVIVTEAADNRSFGEIAASIKEAGLLSRLETIESEPEESFENAAKETRNLQCVTWLGLSRDVRIFEAGFCAFFYTGPACESQDFVQPKFHGADVILPESDGSSVRYSYTAGRGIGCVQGLERWLEHGILPILNARLTDDDVCYTTKMFTTHEKSPLSGETLHGTHYLVSDHYSRGSTMTKAQVELKDLLLDSEMERDEETVLYIRIEVANTAKVPRYCWVRMPHPENCKYPEPDSIKHEYDAGRGFGSFGNDRVFLVADFNGGPMPQPEMAVLLKPGERAEYTFKIPHKPISLARAEALAKEDYGKRLGECIGFWKSNLDGAARFSVPESRVDEMMKAGMLHLDLICYGNEPDGPVAPTVGRYSPIGSESSPIIQYFDSMGKNDLARRCIMYFVEKQHEDGFMQNFRNYMLETGAVLWNIGEHWRYTQDSGWIASIRRNIVKACDYIISWMDRNRKEELRGKWYGMIDGKVADPEDQYHLYMLNGFACLGLARSAEVLKEIDPAESDRIAEAASALRNDIRSALERNMAECPVIPLGNGSWCPSAPPWAEKCGPVSLYAEPGSCFTHDSFTTRDALLGPVYLIMQEVLKPGEPMGDFILKSYAELFYLRNTAFSQPYYSPHPYAHLKRGEVKAFLKEYYNGVSSLADRETYTFWEHYSHVSAHKTHEEGWFLMRSRWMLYMEEGKTLCLLPGIPGKWLEQGKKISIGGMISYFGPIFLEVESDVDNGRIKVSIGIDAPVSRLPEAIRIRLPHPDMKKASRTNMGKYYPDTETVMIEGFTGKVEFEVEYD